MSVVTLEESCRELERLVFTPLEDFLQNGKIESMDPDTKKQTVFSNQRYMECYTIVYTGSTQRQPANISAGLYDFYVSSVEKYLRTKVYPSLDHLSGDALLSAVGNAWVSHLCYLKSLIIIFRYLDRFYVKLVQKDDLQKAGLKLFYSEIFVRIKKELETAIVARVASERRSNSESNLLQVLSELHQAYESIYPGLYSNSFEQPLLRNIAQNYTKWCSIWISETTVSDYCTLVDRALKDEAAKALKYMHPSSHPKVKCVILEALIHRPMKEILKKNSGMAFLIEKDQHTELGLLYRLFSLVEGGNQALSDQFKEIIIKYGEEINESFLNLFREVRARHANLSPCSAEYLSCHCQLVENLMALHERVRVITNGSFQGDPLVQKALKGGMESVVNSTALEAEGAYFSVSLVAYVDKCLRRVEEGKTQGDLDMVLSNVVDLFVFINEKDVFAASYRTVFAKRLLFHTGGGTGGVGGGRGVGGGVGGGGGVSMDCERAFLSKIKLKCGSQFTSKLEGMINDVASGGLLSEEFNASSHYPKSIENFDFSIRVLATGNWPTFKITNLILPPSLDIYFQQFKVFYDTNTSHRKLTLVHPLSTCQVRYRCGREYDISCNIYQACVLLLFNNRYKDAVTPVTQLLTDKNEPILSLLDINNHLDIDDTISRKVMATILYGKHHILVKHNEESTGEEKGRNTISSKDLFVVNREFSCPSKKLKFPNVNLEDNAPVKEKVDTDRTVMIEAAIVRILKARKTITHNELVSLVTRQLVLFQPSIKDIKLRIEALIEREYIERDANESSTYNYIA